MFHRYLAIMCLARDQRCCYFLECVVKRLVVQEDPVIIVVSVESVFDLPD